MAVFDPESWKRLLHADETTWLDFLGTHSLQHHQYDVAIRALGGEPYAVLPIGQSARGEYLLGPDDETQLKFYPDDDWHQAHQVMHDGMAGSLIIAAADDFRSYDLTQEEQFATWSYLHALEHIRIRQALGF